MNRVTSEPLLSVRLVKVIKLAEDGLDENLVGDFAQVSALTEMAPGAVRVEFGGWSGGSTRQGWGILQPARAQGASRGKTAALPRQSPLASVNYLSGGQL